MYQLRIYVLVSIVIVSSCSITGINHTRFTTVDTAWASNSINTAIFRKNAIVSGGGYQYISYYSTTAEVIIAKRKLGTDTWQKKATGLKGNIRDAHNVISMMLDGEGYLHLAWDHHNHPLHYVRSTAPHSLEFSAPQAMTGAQEKKVSYPEFYRLPGGDLLFLYRDGASGNGNLVIKRYDLKSKQWTGVQSSLIDGEGARNAYWQCYVDAPGTIHLSWVWRESPDVASNHDLCYARSTDGGLSWTDAAGKPYHLPIKASEVKPVIPIPQRSELINQTSMTADEQGRPMIATYWKQAGDSVPQYHLSWYDGGWKDVDLRFRKKAFSLSGAGTKRIPISRPQVICWSINGRRNAALIFRDEERGSRPSIAWCKDLSVRTPHWKFADLSNEDLGSWEPCFDTELWRNERTLHLFIQRTEQSDGEGISYFDAQPVKVLEWKPLK